jgi:hypothetical protein
MHRVDGLLHGFLSGASSDVTFSPSLMNIILSAHAWHGSPKECLALLDLFHEKEWSPDIDSFTFALEAVGKSSKRIVMSESLKKDPGKRKNLLDWHLEIAEYILNQVEETRDKQGNPIQLNKRFIRNYVEFLCLLDDHKTAGLVAIDFMEQAGRLEQIVDNKTLLCIAVAHAKKGDFDLARQFVASFSERLPFVDIKIDRIQDDQKEIPKTEGSAPDSSGVPEEALPS